MVLLVPPVNAVIYLLSGLRACHEHCGEGGERMVSVFVMAELIYNPILLLIVVHVWSGAAQVASTAQVRDMVVGAYAKKEYNKSLNPCCLFRSRLICMLRFTCLGCAWNVK